MVPVRLRASIVLAFAVGVLWQKVTTLEEVSSGVAGAKVADAQDAPEAPPALPNGKLSAEQAERVPAVSDDDHKKGSGTVYIIGYSDMECPFCKQFHSTLQDLVDEYEGKVVWVYRHFPLDALHSKARLEAEATECADEIGGNEKFWEYLNTLYEVTPSNNQFDLNELPKIAEQVGLDVDEFNKCLEERRHADKVSDHLEDAINSGARGTPYSILIGPNGEKVVIAGAEPVESVRAKIEKLLGST